MRVQYLLNPKGYAVYSIWDESDPHIAFGPSECEWLVPVPEPEAKLASITPAAEVAETLAALVRRDDAARAALAQFYENPSDEALEAYHRHVVSSQ